jgi:hypothetical protein
LLEEELSSWFDFSHQCGGIQQFLFSGAGTDVTKLPRRRLPPGDTAKLFLLYSAEAEQAGHAHYSYFRTQWRQRWRKCLEFGQASTHSACDECQKFKVHKRSCAGNNSIDILAEGYEYIAAYQTHLNLMWRNRSYAWACMEYAEQAFASGRQPAFVFMVADGMDQAKWRVPRFPENQVMHSLAGAQRPSVVVEAVWMLGVRIDFFLLDKDQAHGSSSVIQCVALSLERAAAQFAARGLALPRIIMLLVPDLPVLPYTIVFNSAPDLDRASGSPPGVPGGPMYSHKQQLVASTFVG